MVSVYRYFESTECHNSAHRHVYSVKHDGTGFPLCLTCANNCHYGSAMFSKDASYYVLSCYGPGLPTFDLYDKVFKLTIMYNYSSLLKIDRLWVFLLNFYQNKDVDW